MNSVIKAVSGQRRELLLYYRLSCALHTHAFFTLPDWQYPALDEYKNIDKNALIE